jgi:hypothetical protein
VYLVQPLLSAIGSLLVSLDFDLKLGDALLRSAKLLRKPLRGIDSVPAILLGKISSLVKELQDRLTSGIKLAAIALPRRRARELNYLGTHGLALFPIGDLYYNLVFCIRHVFVPVDRRG